MRVADVCARINIMPRAARFTGNALQTIFPPITRAAQGVDGWSEGCWAHTRGCGSPEGCDVAEGTTGGPACTLRVYER